MQLKLTEPIDWANNAGYEVIDINDGYRENIKLVFSPYPAFQVGNIEIASTAYKNPIYIKAKNVKIVVINNDQNESTHNYKYFLISSNNDLLIDDQINRKHWLKYFNVFNEIDEKKIDFDLNNISIKHKIKNEDELIFVGGHAHFGHWLVDHLPIILFCEKNGIRKKGGKYLTSQLNEFQIETLKSSNIKIDVLQLSVGKNYLNIIEIDEINILSYLSIYKSYELLRNKFTVNEESKKIIKNNKKIYFERGLQRGLKRIENEEKVINYLKKENFDIVKTDELSINQKKEILYTYDLFVSSPGSAYFNFSIFSNINAKLIYNIHESALYNLDVAVYGASYYQCPDLYRTTLIPALQPSLKSLDIPVYDALCKIDLEAIKEKLNEFKIKKND